MNRTRTLLVSYAVTGLLAAGCVWSADRTTLEGGGGNNGTGNSGGPGGRRAGIGGGGGGGITPDAGELTADASCGVSMYSVSSTPDLLILLDKSLSMNDSPGSGTGSKWVQMTAAINQVVADPALTAWWGLKFFGDGTGLCGVGAGAAVAPAAGSAPAIATAIAANMPATSTPTRPALTAAGAYLRGLTDPNPKYIILATDGLPTCAAGSTNTQATDAPGAEQAVSDQLTAGTKTYVIGIATSGDATATATLTQMAANGGTGSPYFPVSNTADLVTALSTIQGQTRGCVFPLGQVPPNPDNILVKADGANIPKDTTNTSGWNYVSSAMTSVQIFGSYCTDYMNMTTADVQVILGCGIPLVP
jgi:hypothetical protein